MGGLDHKENVVTRAALVREVMMVVLDRMDLPDFLDLKELLVALEQLEVLAQMALMDSLVSDDVLLKTLKDLLKITLCLFMLSSAFYSLLALFL